MTRRKSFARQGDILAIFQIADLVCTVKQKLAAGIAMTESEQRFFGGPRMFKRETLRRIKAKELE